MTAPPADLKRVAVGIGQLAVSSDPRDMLVAYGLGSCIGVTAYDPAKKVAGLAHVLLPASVGRPIVADEPARFADSAIDTLLKELVALGAMRTQLVVKVAGGASVLGPANAEKFKIGEKNAEAVRERLRHHGLRVAAEDVGGVMGRTLEFHLATGRTYVRTAASPPTEL